MLSNITFKIPKESLEFFPQVIRNQNQDYLFIRYGGKRKPTGNLCFDPFQSFAFGVKPQDFANYNPHELREIIRMFSMATSSNPSKLEITSFIVRIALRIQKPLNLYYEPQEVIEQIKTFDSQSPSSQLITNSDEYWFKTFEGKDSYLSVREGESNSEISAHEVLEFEVKLKEEALQELGRINLRDLTSTHVTHKIVQFFMAQIRKIDSPKIEIVEPIERKCIELLAA